MLTADSESPIDLDLVVILYDSSGYSSFVRKKEQS